MRYELNEDHLVLIEYDNKFTTRRIHFLSLDDAKYVRDMLEDRELQFNGLMEAFSTLQIIKKLFWKNNKVTSIIDKILEYKGLKDK